MNDDDCIPFDGPRGGLRGTNGQPKKLSPEEVEKVKELVKKLKLNQPGRLGRPSSGTGQ